ncbi:MAG: transglutaminase domain-containing protein [Candidatus Coproplasma sp.]
MKKSILILTVSLIVTLCAGFVFAGCDFLAGLDPNHTHNPSTTWSGDSTYHWHECTAFGCKEQLDKAEHTLEHVEAVGATCTDGGNVEYWHCTGCDKYYSDAGATTVIKSVTVSATGHKIVEKYDAQTHWQECETCNQVISAPQAHSSSTYVKNKAGHYKICSVCGIKFDEGSHENGEDCLICGYTPDYTDLCSSDYGYIYLGTLENGDKYQSFYEKMDEAVKAFHNDQTKDATSVSLTSGTAYVAGQVDYATFGLTVNQAQSVWATYRHDHPLYYWLLGQVVYNSQTLSLCVDSDYKDGSARVAQNELIYAAIDGYLSSVSGETSAYLTAFAFHDMIIDNIDYAYDGDGYPDTSNSAHSVLGVFCDGSAVCEGYAKAFSLLLNASGIDNAYVTGTSKGVGHAWNLVEIDGNWYWYDLTWDDQPQIGGGTIYDYMCCYGETFADHTVDQIGNMSNPMNFLYALPAAATVEYNTTSLEYGEQFTLSGLTYEVCGYNEVSVVGSSSVSGAVVLAESVTYGERTYTLTEIGTEAFRNSRWITSITIPQSVKVIYNLAFSGCSGLNSVTFEDKSGWSRSSSNGTEKIAESSLESASSAASLLKETCNVGLSRYEYTWVKTASAQSIAD